VADLTLILTSGRLLELLFPEFIVIMGREQEKTVTRTFIHAKRV